MPAKIETAWAIVLEAQRLLGLSGEVDATSEVGNRVFLAQVVCDLGPSCALWVLDELLEWCAGDLRESPAVAYIHGLASVWQKELAEVPDRYRRPKPEEFDFIPLLSYQLLAAQVSVESAMETATMLGSLESGAGSRRLAGPPEPGKDECVWVARLKEGQRLLDVGIETGVSERTLYRKLAAIRRRYRVASNYELVLLFDRQGWLG